MLNFIKLALRITTDVFDDEIQLYIDDCLAELTAMGVTNLMITETEYDPQVKSAVVAYVKWKFGNNEDKDAWAAIYHGKLAQFQTMTGHTEWGDLNG